MFRRNELYGGSSEVFVGGQHIEALDLGFLDDFVKWFAQYQCVIEGSARWIFREADSGGSVRLGITIDEKCRLFDGTEACG